MVALREGSQIGVLYRAMHEVGAGEAFNHRWDGSGLLECVCVWVEVACALFP